MVPFFFANGIVAGVFFVFFSITCPFSERDESDVLIRRYRLPLRWIEFSPVFFAFFFFASSFLRLPEYFVGISIKKTVGSWFVELRFIAPVDANCHAILRGSGKVI